MKRLPKMYRKKNKAGRQVGNWIAKVSGDEVNLGTKDAELARRHLREAVEEGRRDFVDEIDVAAAAFGDTTREAPPAPPAAPAAAPAAPASPEAAAPAAPAAPLQLPAIQPVPDPQDFADTAAAATEAAGAGPEGFAGDAAPDGGVDPEEVEVTTEEIAQFGVEAQVWVAAWHARRTVYDGFIPPPTPPELRDPLAKKWTRILNYAGAAAVLPPWVTGLVFPGIAIIGSTYAMGLAFGAIAEEQRKAAGAPPKPTEAAAA